MRRPHTLFYDGWMLHVKTVVMSTEIIDDSSETITNVSGFIYSLLLA